MSKKRQKQESPNNRSTEEIELPLSTKNLGEQLIEALKQQDVVDSFAKAIGPVISLTVQETVVKLLEAVNKNIEMLTADNKKLNDVVRVTVEENKSLKTRLAAVEGQLDTLDKERRQRNIIIRGLPERTFAERATADGNSDNVADNNHLSVKQSVIEMCDSQLKVKLEPGDIEEAYRIKAGPRDKCRPVVVKFTKRFTRQDILSKKKTLRNSDKQIYISEDLTKTTADMFSKARALIKDKKIHAAWTFNGNLFIRKSADPSARPVLIRSVSDMPR